MNPDTEHALLVNDLSHLATVAVQLAALVPPHQPLDVPPLDLSGMDESDLMAVLAGLTSRVLSREVEATT